jgi:hypothetical protein
MLTDKDRRGVARENKRRAKKAREALAKYSPGGNLEERLTDLLADCMHLCAETGLNYFNVSSRAIRHVFTERSTAYIPPKT